MSVTHSTFSVSLHTLRQVGVVGDRRVHRRPAELRPVVVPGRRGGGREGEAEGECASRRRESHRRVHLMGPARGAARASGWFRPPPFGYWPGSMMWAADMPASMIHVPAWV